MKTGQEAITQYAELAEALVQMGADWIVTEVDEVISRGKTVPFRDLSAEESARYEGRLSEETRRGLTVGRAKANDSIGVPYEPHERLALLIDALERVITTSELAQSYISAFSSRLGITSIRLESPPGADSTGSRPESWSLPLAKPSLINERLAILRHVLHDEVLG